MKDDFTTNSHYLIYTFLFRKVGRMYFVNLGVKGLTLSLPSSISTFFQPSKDKCESEVVRIDGHNHLSFEQAMNSQVLHTL